MRYICQPYIVDVVFANTSDLSKNCIFSPSCNFIFLKLLSELTDEESKSVFEKCIDYDLKHLDRLLKFTNRADKKLAFKIFQNLRYPLEKPIETLARGKFNSEIETFSDEHPLDIEKAIQDWLKEYTNETFSELIEGFGINRATSYNISWAKTFDKTKTDQRKFHQNTSDSFDVDMMHISGKFKYYEDDEENKKIIELPCVNAAGIRHKDVSVLIYLPDNQGSEELDLFYMMEDELIELIKKMENVDVEVSIPKFKIKTECNMQNVFMNEMWGVSIDLFFSLYVFDCLTCFCHLFSYFLINIIVPRQIDSKVFKFHYQFVSSLHLM